VVKNAYKVVKTLDPWVILEERLPLLTRPGGVLTDLVERVRVHVDGDCFQARVLVGNPMNKRLENWIPTEVVEVLEERKRQDRKETFWGYRRTRTDTQDFKICKLLHVIVIKLV